MEKPVIVEAEIVGSTPTPPLYLTDRTTIETDWKCGMARWWYKHEAGTGIVPAKESDYLEQGRWIHEDFALLLEDVPVEDVLARRPVPTDDQLAAEPIQRHRGWVAQFALDILPNIRANYDIIAVEREIVLAREPLWIVCTPDLVLRRRDTKRLRVWDWKSAGMITRDWVDYWPRAIQHHINLKAVEEEYGERPECGQIIGLLKGRPSYGRLAHPYVWAYSNGDRWQHERATGLTHRPLWEYTPGILHWVSSLSAYIRAAVMPFSAPIILDDRLLGDMLEARIAREALCAASSPRDPRVFEPRSSHCRPVIGAPCAYLAACHNAQVNANPLASGLYVPRTPHHELEAISAEAE